MSTRFRRTKAGFSPSLSLLLLIPLLCVATVSAEPLATDAAPLSATLPNGRRITPAGAWIQVAPFPYTLPIRPDGDQLVVPSIGWPFSLNIKTPDGCPMLSATRSTWA